ncbi:hypothetical protein [Thiomicrorhabdus sp. Milos-T2]|uniref:hypothetical protein n=1 Tax=Thiomicrorhabdus sp. Milos-T2 TaxID=90814 RepID=UPI00068B1656|nr:hypothetical protein [Thiomicrorhabdus sp. Milos-T2]
MPNTITDNPFLKQLFENKDANKNNKPGQDVSELAKAKQQADQVAQQANMGDVSYDPSSKALQSMASMQQVERAYQYSETTRLQLTTKEGDKVSVDFRQLYAQYQSYKEMHSEEQGPKGVRQFDSREAMEMTAFEEQFAFSVDGDLNEDELKAVFDVFEQVDTLSNQFFDGNIEKALQQANELQIDFGQLSSISLNLTQSESMAVRQQQAALAEYSDVQKQTNPEETDETADDYGVNMADLPPYLQTWQDTINHLDEQFQNSQDFLNGLMGEINAQRFPDQDTRPGWLERVRAFHEELMAMANKESEKTLQEPTEVTPTENSETPLPEENLVNND